MKNRGLARAPPVTFVSHEVRESTNRCFAFEGEGWEDSSRDRGGVVPSAYRNRSNGMLSKITESRDHARVGAGTG